MQIYSLASGSKGNCTLISTKDRYILIDVGISVKQINQKLLMSSGIDLDDVSLVLVTHSHTDHIKSCQTIYNKYNHIKFYCSEVTYEEICSHHKVIFDRERFVISSVETKGNVLTITPFELKHDKESQSYMIYDGDETYAHISDCGSLYDKDIINMLHNKTHYSIESNYDVELTYFDEKRQPVLKKRCLGSYGHMSNIGAIELVCKLVGDNTKHVMFNHLSEETNSEEIAKRWHMKHLEIYSKLELTKYIKFSYAKQNEIVNIHSGKTHKEIRGVR